MATQAEERTVVSEEIKICKRIQITPCRRVRENKPKSGAFAEFHQNLASYPLQSIQYSMSAG
jgi:hypothetical protein